jgi:LAO/AO transport system kinase
VTTKEIRSQEAKDFIKAMKLGDHRMIARCITLVENELPGYLNLLKELKSSDIPVIGITGPPGAGKSTLINAYVRLKVSEGKRIAVIAIDPTSPFNFGSLLGDRLRMTEHFNNENIFIRSLATRGSLGGLSEKIIEITDVLRNAYFDLIIIETVGVGQSEIEIAGLADTTVVVFVPESGDEVQAMKAGIMEIADVFVINKSDRPGGDLLAATIKKMIRPKMDSWEVPVLKTIATTGAGLDQLDKAINHHHQTVKTGQKRLFLLTEKVYQLIKKQRMQNVRREDISKELQLALNKGDVNIYTFAEKLSSTAGTSETR